jgi:hypothetical protein
VAALPPNAPINVTLDVSSHDKLRLQWRQATDGGRPDKYRIEQREQGTSSWSPVDVVDRGVVEHVLTGLRPSTMYEVRIRAENMYGVSTWVGKNQQTIAPPVAKPPSGGGGGGGSVTPSISYSSSGTVRFGWGPTEDVLAPRGEVETTYGWNTYTGTGTPRYGSGSCSSSGVTCRGFALITNKSRSAAMLNLVITAPSNASAAVLSQFRNRTIQASITVGGKRYSITASPSSSQELDNGRTRVVHQRLSVSQAATANDVWVDAGSGRVVVRLV